jgi:hypothetical protein
MIPRQNKEGKMSTKKVMSAVLAVSAVLLALVFGFQRADRVHALPLGLPNVSQAGGESATGTALSHSYLTPAVVYVDNNGHIHEIALKGTWQDRDLTAAAGAPVVAHSGVIQPMAYRRSDGVSMVIYRGADDDIHSLYLELRRQGNNWQEVWHWADLSAITGSPAAASDPYGYVRSDGISTVVYTGSDGDIHELRLEGGWIWADLTAIAVAPTAIPGSRPVAYVRGDGINAVVYEAAVSGQICELRLDNGWKWTNLSGPSGAPLPLSDLSAYVRSDGISTINYAGYDHHIYDLRLETGWISVDLTAISGAPETESRPFGYVRSDGINAIVYATSGADAGRIYELRLDNGWQYYELTSVPDAVRGYRPVGYVRADGISEVVYLGGSVWHVQDIRLETAWQWADLTYLAGAPATASYPWPYNRSVVARVYLPLVVRH